MSRSYREVWPHVEVKALEESRRKLELDVNEKLVF